LGLSALKDAHTYIPADPALCDAYNDGVGPGPTPVPQEPGSDKMFIKLDFRPGVSFEKGWNLTCCEMVTDHLMAGIDVLSSKMPFSLPENRRAYLLSAAQAKCAAYFRYFKIPVMEMRKNPQASYTEIGELVTQRHQATNDVVKKTSRRASVRTILGLYFAELTQRQTYFMRLKIITAMLIRCRDNKKISKDVKDMWTSLDTYVRGLGMDGTSDDEEDADGTKPYKVLTHPWRNPDIPDWMDFIEARYHLVRSNTGNTMRRRIRTGGVSQRQFIPNLDPWLYNPELPVDRLTIKPASQGLSRIGLSNVEGLQ
jgi:hypothetical protein